MYISTLLIDVGANPDRPRPGRLWLRNLYHVHQRLCMAFPSAARKAADPQFLAPYRPDDFPEHRYLADRKRLEVGCETLRHVHARRSADSGFLFRIDPLPGGRVVIVVQSALEPDWDYAFHNAGHLLAAPPDCGPFDPRFAPAERLRFRLLANPTRRLRADSREKDGIPVAARWVGKRVPVPADQLFDWLARRAAASASFSVDAESTLVVPGYVYVNWTRDKKGYRLRSARYDGFLTVTDPVRFRQTLVEGVGPAKAFGFGLLSVARAS
ncbi:MAG: type I-E CRISPR-associated protein Cas6/Cse3/CasE [Thermoguttaceae bacterium]|jgi:CRISPR system Cascade subunit CasE|nr:type I-E CRISPR-associated protein Cas6/Cse3/CasE [Thermoguttaceae bacterium]